MSNISQFLNTLSSLIKIYSIISRWAINGGNRSQILGTVSHFINNNTKLLCHSNIVIILETTFFFYPTGNCTTPPPPHLQRLYKLTFLSVLNNTRLVGIYLVDTTLLQLKTNKQTNRRSEQISSAKPSFLRLIRVWCFHHYVMSYNRSLHCPYISINFQARPSLHQP